MKTTQTVASAIISLMIAASAQAETYDGVLQSPNLRSRAEVDVDATAAARSGDLYGTAASSGVVAPIKNPKLRETVNGEAVAEAHAPNQNLTGKAYYRDAIPSQYQIQPTRETAAK